MSTNAALAAPTEAVNTPQVSSTKAPTPPFLDLQAQYLTIREELAAAIMRVMDSQHFILGPEVERFEKDVAGFLQTKAAVGCASGSDALLLALLSLSIGPGDEVITTPFTFVATAGAIARTGAKPVFVDILPDTYNIDPSLIEPASTARTRAIIPVHLFGLSCDLDPIMEFARRAKLEVIEDAAQAIGARYKGRFAGTVGALGCFSFFPSKNLGAAGDAGLVTTERPELADTLRLLRAHGSRVKYHSEIVGTNSRLDAIHAAILGVKLRHLEDWSTRRREKAAAYKQLFEEFKLTDVVRLPMTPTSYEHVFNQFVIRCPKDRDNLKIFLRDMGVPTEVYYPEPLHTQPAFDYLGYKSGQFPHAEAACRQVLALPIYPELKQDRQVAAVRAIAAFYKAT